MEIFGLMASRPKELSYEGPEFGGGHGAFTYSLLKGLQGEADANHDGIVNVNELIDYVRDRSVTDRLGRPDRPCPPELVGEERPEVRLPDSVLDDVGREGHLEPQSLLLVA